MSQELSFQRICEGEISSVKRHSSSGAKPSSAGQKGRTLKKAVAKDHV
jgi:hypothetical protein